VKAGGEKESYNAGYFFLGDAFFTFAGLAAGLSAYSSGWWRLQV
jgi:hypothetical protein